MMRAGGSVDVLVFEVGGQRFGADASQVLRIEPPQEGALRPQGFDAPHGDRALVFRAPGGERQLQVDSVWGIAEVPVTALRRMPAPAEGAPYAIGVWLDARGPVLLIDLLLLHDSQGRQ